MTLGAKADPGEKPASAARPSFTLSFPTDPELDDLVALFARGDYAAVRVKAPELAGRATDPRVAAAARELLRRLSPDPLMIYLMVVAGVLLVVLTVWALAIGHGWGAVAWSGHA